MSALDGYFRAVVALELPRRVTTVDDDGTLFNGTAAFESQVSKLRELIKSLSRDRVKAVAVPGAAIDNHTSSGGAARALTSRHGLWYKILPKIVRALNDGETMHVSRLIDEAWISSLAESAGMRGHGTTPFSPEAAFDAYRAFLVALRPPPALSDRAPLLAEDVLNRYSSYHALACDVAVRVTAARLRGVDSFLRSAAQGRGFARRWLELVLDALYDVAPCRAVYGGSGCGTPIERPREPVVCLQERRSHADDSHRGSRRVRGGGTSLWTRVVGAVVPYHPVWPGKFRDDGTSANSSSVTVQDAGALAELSLGLSEAPPAVFSLTSLVALAADHSSANVRVEYANIVSSTDGAATLAPPTSRVNAACAQLRRALPLRSEPVSAHVSPYCIGCARISTDACNSDATVAVNRDVNNRTAAPTDAIHASDAVSDVQARRAFGGYAAWLAELFTGSLAMPGSSSDSTHPFVDAVEPVQASLLTSRGILRGGAQTSNSFLRETSAVAVHRITLGLCDSCVCEAAKHVV